MGVTRSAHLDVVALTVGHVVLVERKAAYTKQSEGQWLEGEGMEGADDKTKGYLHLCQLGELAELVYTRLDLCTQSFIGLETRQSTSLPYCSRSHTLCVAGSNFEARQKAKRALRVVVAAPGVNSTPA